MCTRALYYLATDQDSAGEETRAPIGVECMPFIVHWRNFVYKRRFVVLQIYCVVDSLTPLADAPVHCSTVSFVLNGGGGAFMTALLCRVSAAVR